MHADMTTADRDAARRKGVRRTAWTVGAIAVAIYVAFLLSGMLPK